MLFVLRLLPPNTKRQQYIVFIAFFLNFAITVVATVSYGVKCIPFNAIYEPVASKKCLPDNVITTTMIVNAGELTRLVHYRY